MKQKSNCKDPHTVKVVEISEYSRLSTCSQVSSEACTDSRVMGKQRNAHWNWWKIPDVDVKPTLNPRTGPPEIWDRNKLIQKQVVAIVEELDGGDEPQRTAEIYCSGLLCTRCTPSTFGSKSCAIQKLLHNHLFLISERLPIWFVGTTNPPNKKNLLGITYKGSYSSQKKTTFGTKYLHNPVSNAIETK